MRTFFSCDWGTTSLRLRWVEAATGRVLSEVQAENSGVREVASTVSRNASAAERAQPFTKVLARHLAALPGSEGAVDALPPVVISGMASSSIGWKELPYASLPIPVDGSGVVGEWLAVRVGERRLPVLLVSGVASATDMMRGEETQVVGLLTQPSRAEWARAGRVVLPGTHSKHVCVENGQIVGLHTFMTGEVYEVLCRHSVLRFTTAPDTGFLDERAFREGVQVASRDGLVRSLFQVRTRGVLGGQSGLANRSFLSGLLIGAELRELQDAPRVLLAAPEAVARLYQQAAAELNHRGHFEVTGTEELQQAVVRGQSLFLQKLGALRRCSPSR